MPRASLKIERIKPVWTVIYPVYGGEAGRDFRNELFAYWFAMNHRPSRVMIHADNLYGLVAEFPLEPEWFGG